METKVIVEKPLFTLTTENYDDCGMLRVYASDLKNADVGDSFVPYTNSNCGRGVDEESLEVVYKSDSGVAVLYRHYGTTDSPNPVEWSNDPELIWVEIH